MAFATSRMLSALAGVVAASAVTAMAGLLAGGLSPGLAAVACGLWTVAAWPSLGLPALAALVPALGLLPGAGPLALAGWSVAALGLALVGHHLGQPDPDQLRQLRNELRDVEHERNLLSRHLQRYPMLIETSLELSAAREFDQFAGVLCRRTHEILPEAAEVLVFIGHGAEQTCRASVDRRGRVCPREAGIDERFVASEARSLIRRNQDELRALIPLRGDRRQAGSDAVPLRGVLAVRLQLGEVGDRLVLEVLDALGRLGGLGLAAVDLVYQARSLALHDDLTGLFGQHEFLRRLDEQAAACRRRGLSLGVLMCDLDRLKLFNDRFGHAAGDTALRAVAVALRKALPREAIVCRYGGEEFTALLPDIAPAAMAELAEKVRQAVAETQPEAAHQERQVTASLGWAMLASDETGRALLARADQACYRAKAGGRNRVEAAP